MTYLTVSIVIMVCNECGDKEKIKIKRDGSLYTGRRKGWKIQVLSRGLLHICPKCVKSWSKENAGK